MTLSYKYRDAVLGFLTGLLFPCLGLVLDALLVHRGDSLAYLFRANPVHWVVASAPLVLGAAGFAIGTFRGRVLALIADLEKINQAQSMEISENVRRIEVTNREMQAIVDNIHTGLCTVDRSGVIRGQHNELIYTIFGRVEYSGRSIFDNIFYILETEMKKELQEFVDLAFSNQTATTAMLNSALPLKEFIYVHNEEGRVQHKNIRINVVRVSTGSPDTDRLMFLFEDVTVEEQLRAEDGKKQRDFERQYATIAALFGHDRDVIRRFLKDLDAGLEETRRAIGALRQDETNDEDLSRMVAIIHSIKGEAFSLDFRELADTAGEFEQYLRSIITKTVDIEHNLQIVSFFERLTSEKESFDGVIGKLSLFLDGNDESLHDDSADEGLVDHGPEPVELSVLEKGAEDGKPEGG